MPDPNLEDLVAERMYDAVRGVGTAPADGSTRPASLKVFLGRSLPFEEDDVPAANLFLADQETDRAPNAWGPLNQHGLLVGVEVVAVVLRKADPENPGQYVDEPWWKATSEHLGWARKAIMADESLGGVANGVQEVGADWRLDFEGEVPLAVAVLIYRINYHTLATNPERRS